MFAFYAGGGAQIHVDIFTSLRMSGTAFRGRRTITGGGLNLNALVGVELMRASAAQVHMQLVLSMPAWLFDNPFQSYLPSLSVTVGILL